MAVGQMMDELTNGPTAGTVGHIELLIVKPGNRLFQVRRQVLKLAQPLRDCDCRDMFWRFVAANRVPKISTGT
jgi:hypothetical protein